MTDQETIDRLVIALAMATGTPEALVRLGVGLPPIPPATVHTYREDGGSWSGSGS